MPDVSIRWEPLSSWPASRPRSASHDDAKFAGGGKWEPNGTGGNTFVSGKRTTLTRTLLDLDRELYHAGAVDVVCQVDAANKEDFRRELRRDGQIREDVRVKSPAVVLTFKRRKNGVPLLFACDRFRRWQDNLRAIALGLEGLRRLERYHIAQTGDQYRGWQALPSSTTTALNAEQAAAVLARRSTYTVQSILATVGVAQLAYRAAAGSSHPDAGGSTSDFQLVQEAKRVLEAHLGGTL